MATSTKSTLKSFNSKSQQNKFKYEAFSEVVAALTTRLQMNSLPKMSTVNGDFIAQDEPCVCHKGPIDSIEQHRLL